MKVNHSLFIGMMSLGVIGILWNIFLGFGLTSHSPPDANAHLATALISIFLLLFSSAALIKTSTGWLSSHQKNLLMDKKTEESKNQAHRLQTLRSKAVTGSSVLSVLCLISLISGTISQSGHLPIVHALTGLAVAGFGISACYYWIQLFRKD